MMKAIAGPKYYVPFGMMLLMCLIVIIKSDNLPSNDINLSLFNTSVKLMDGALRVQKEVGSAKDLFSIISNNRAQFDVIVNDEKVIQNCPKALIWITLVLSLLLYLFVRVKLRIKKINILVD